jgi:diguanylate cyclase (GGDEF)-like protein
MSANRATFWFLKNNPGQFEHEALQSLIEAGADIRAFDHLDALLTEMGASAQPVVFVAPVTTTEDFNRLLGQTQDWPADIQCLGIIPAEAAIRFASFTFPGHPSWDWLFLPTHQETIQARLGVVSTTAAMRRQMVAWEGTDAATGLRNRRDFNHRLSQELARGRRHGDPFSVVVASLEGYAWYVDSFGYETAVAMLAHAARILGQVARQEDVLSRLADDEIGLLMPKCTESGALSMLERVQEALLASPFRLPDGEDENLSIFAGVAAYPMPTSELPPDADTLIRYAHHALHMAQQQAPARTGKDPMKGRFLAFSLLRPTV